VYQAEVSSVFHRFFIAVGEEPAEPFFEPFLEAGEAILCDHEKVHGVGFSDWALQLTPFGAGRGNFHALFY
jgi:hypothetical protein